MAQPFLDRDLRVKPINAWIDPPWPQARAIITHGHSDHARPGHGAVLATPDTIAIMQARYGPDCAGSFQALDYRTPLEIDGVTVTLYPAGHILGSAQVLLEHEGQRIVVTGDYKRLPDRTAQAFELVQCDLLVTEATFGLPVFQHPDPLTEVARLLRSVEAFPERAHVIGCYALGKAQRMISLLREAGYDAPIYLHGAMLSLCALYEERGIALGGVAACARRAQGAVRRADRHRPALGAQGPLEPPAARSGAVHGLGLDERQAARPAERGGAAAGDLRPCRLERTPADHRRYAVRRRSG